MMRVALAWILVAAVCAIAQDELSACLRAGLGGHAASTYADFTNGVPSRLRLHTAWRSARAAAVPLTVATGLTPGRLEQLAAMCMSWKGPLSAAVYMVLQEDAVGGQLRQANVEALAATSAALSTFHQQMDAAGGCQLDMMLLYETVPEADDVMAALLPVNTMRNYALLQARTPLVAMVDVDLLISKILFEWMSQPSNAQIILDGAANKQVFILPAFETPRHPNQTRAHEVAHLAVSSGKPDLAGLVERRLLHQFALYLFRQGHNATDYQRFWAAEAPYDAIWHAEFEPWFIIDRRLNPWYDSVFRGYGWNKVTHVHNVHAQGFRFMVHPVGFLVHRQHGRSKADTMYQAQKNSYEAAARTDPALARRDSSLAGMTHRFRDNMMAALEAGTYQPAVDSGVLECSKVLSWWTGPLRVASAAAASSTSVAAGTAEPPGAASQQAAVAAQQPATQDAAAGPTAAGKEASQVVAAAAEVPATPAATQAAAASGSGTPQQPQQPQPAADPAAAGGGAAAWVDDGHHDHRSPWAVDDNHKHALLDGLEERGSASAEQAAGAAGAGGVAAAGQQGASSSATT